MSLRKDCVINLFAKYEILLAKNGSTDDQIVYFEFHTPQYKVYSLQVLDNMFLYTNLARKLLQKLCELGGISFSKIDKELQSCNYNENK